MAELLNLTSSPVAAWSTWGLLFVLGLIQVGQGLIRLLEAWDRYRAKRRMG